MPTAGTTESPLIALLAGEDSGDQLGADLIAALRTRYPDARFVGIGGKRMQAQGFESWFDIRELSLFGLAEVVSHLPRLLKLRKALVARLLATQPERRAEAIVLLQKLAAAWPDHPQRDDIAALQHQLAGGM